MKKFIGLLPAALAILTVTSCSNEDLFSNNEEVVYTKTLDVTHEGISDNDFTSSLTRSSMKPTDGNKVVYDANDVIRVYDEDVTVYDKYTFDGTQFGTTGTKVSNAKYAIFPSEQVKWGDNDSEPKVAVTIKDYVDLSSTVNGTEVGGVKAFVANIPSWGIVKEGATKSKLEVQLFDMTAVARLAINHLDGFVEGNYLKISSDKKPVKYSNNIAGTFSATLDKNIATTQKNTTTMLAADETLVGSNTMWIYLGTEDIDAAYVYFPLVAGTYDGQDIKIELCHGDGSGNYAAATPTGVFDKDLGTDGTPLTLKRGQVYNVGQIGDITETVTNSDPYYIQKIIEDNKNKGMDVEINVAYGTNKMATSNNEDAKNHTITIPSDLKNNVYLKITGTAAHDISAKDLTINGGTAGKTVTFDFQNTDGITGGEKKLVLNTTSNIVLAGELKNVKLESKKGNVTLGITGGTAFDMTNIGGTAPAFESGDLTINNILPTTAAITYKATGTVNVNASLATLTATETTPAEVNINAAVGTVNTKAAKLNIKADVTTANANSPEINITGARVTNLDPQSGASAINLVNGIVTKLGENSTLFSTATTMAVKSSGISAIGTVTDLSTKNAGFTFTSTWDIPAKKADATPMTIAEVKANATLGALKEIYTAAQLVNAEATSKLMGDVTFADGSLTFVGNNLNGAFDGNKKTITGITGPLFNTISNTAAVEIKDLTLKNVNISKANNAAALCAALNANADADKAITVNNVVVDGGTIGNAAAGSTDANFAGLAAVASGKIVFKNCQVKGVTVKGFENMGGFVGKAEKTNSTNITIRDKKTSSVTFNKTYTATTYAPAEKEKLGTVGNFIGSVNIEDGAVVITVGKDDSENAFSNYFTNTINKDALEFGLHKDAEKSFVGMDGNWIGFSPRTTGSLTINYTGKVGVTRENDSHHEINVFE